jgi:catechol 2,3-dioxygenase-like lactoylglutathione lyase family enzyme
MTESLVRRRKIRTCLWSGQEDRNLSAQLNHTFVWCRDKQKSATFLTEVLGLPTPTRFGSMLVVQLNNAVSLDFREKEGEISSHHYAFLVSEDEFDQVLARFHERGIQHWAEPEKQRPGEVYRHNGGRGLYFNDLDGHILEVMTRPYAHGEAFVYGSGK